MKTSKPMTMADTARYLRDGDFGFGTLRAATEFLRQIRDSRTGTGDRAAFSVDYSRRRFTVLEDEPGDFPEDEGDSMTRPVTRTEAGTALGHIMQAGARRPWTDSEIPDDALDRALGSGAESLEHQRLEVLRAALRAEDISFGELQELQNLVPYIEPGDTELLEAAGVPEHDPAASWDMWAHDRGNGRYDNPGEKWWVEIHGLPDPVVPVLVTEIAGDAPDATHWGWIDARTSSSRLAGVPCMIWASKAAFGAQFPHGVAEEVAAGKGQVVRLRITAREIPPA